jgi:hypothetical protein
MILRRNSKVGAALNPNSAPPAHITPLACVPSSLEVRKKNIHNKIIFKIKTTRNMHSVLSPLAQPFQPVEFAIYNDGVPSSVYYGSHPEHEVLMHIEDEALDETFPPSAHDVSYFIAAT